MRHFSFLDEDQLEHLFFRRPAVLDLDTDPALLAVALGATLYSPGTRPDLASDILKLGSRGVLSMVICLEDSIPDGEVAAAQENVAAALELLYSRRAGSAGAEAVPMLFVRPRSPEQMLALARRCGASMRVLSGFAVPKFENEAGAAQRYFEALAQVRRLVLDAPQSSPGLATDARFWLMPILESPAIIHRETRTQALARIVEVIEENRADVLAVRIGATDFSSAFGLRRTRDLTIYDVQVVASVIADIVNMLGRPEDALVISGPVWEHFDNNERLLRPQLRLTPFAAAHEDALRQRLLTSNLDGLIREIGLDHANGLLGKTVIHPSHVPLVHALSVVSHEDYLDALAIISPTGGGATASPYSNKMNEHKPHRAWAERTLLKADAFGVAAPDINFVDLLEASVR
ncbi:HpcH/HpaI aldolase/citrate lyase family protein [Paeniglutamicibacter cryotolerans]|uniref:Citrate lyase beta subunit n=1 Tax=Paeniglutamicibacter cryotolerans TaxID=670079 RepID=A0A839QPQ5_9MICC|nr:HpcH/HpaI aldolase/citrate lyase family protein [Paeniglutamicibacter cryotolerans]MBB2995222.1 citrate lyase beta subunit [Paeniglutamicibacter cryotolerans]